MNRQQVMARKDELIKEYFPGATIAQVDPRCAPAETRPIFIAWWSVGGKPTGEIDALLELRRSQGDGRLSVLVLFPHGAYYIVNGLCRLISDGPSPRIGPNTTITGANKPWLFEMTTFLAANGYIHPEAAGVTTMSSMVVTGVKRFQKASGLAADGWIGPKTVAAAADTLCKGGTSIVHL